MKLKKILLLPILLLFVSGCEATINLEITEDSYNVRIKGLSDKSVVRDLEYYDQHVAIEYYPIIENGQVQKFSYSDLEDDKVKGREYFYDYDINQFRISTLMSCFNSHAVAEGSNGLMFVLLKGYLCDGFNMMPVDKTTINITTNLKVDKHNADSVNGNTYTWNMEGNDSIEFNYYRTPQPEEDPSDPQLFAGVDLGSREALIIILAILIVAALVTTVINKKKSQKD